MSRTVPTKEPYDDGKGIFSRVWLKFFIEIWTNIKKLNLDTLTASRLLATDSDTEFESVSNLTSWIAGTTNRVTVADDGDGTVTLSAPQDIHTGASPTFAGLTTTAGRRKATTRITSVDSPYTALVTDHAIFVDTDGGAITVNLPAGVDGTEYQISNCGSSGNDVTVDGSTTETINGDLTQTLNDDEAINIIFETTENWRVF